ncbi:MAG: hypothetical protein H6R01_1512 [Burkholderiaceae bacterium]|nr:hypothetical protein [Burkholderiaceae bacterium]
MRILLETIAVFALIALILAAPPAIEKYNKSREAAATKQKIRQQRMAEEANAEFKRRQPTEDFNKMLAPIAQAEVRK